MALKADSYVQKANYSDSLKVHLLFAIINRAIGDENPLFWHIYTIKSWFLGWSSPKPDVMFTYQSKMAAIWTIYAKKLYKMSP